MMLSSIGDEYVWWLCIRKKVCSVCLANGLMYWLIRRCNFVAKC